MTAGRETGPSLKWSIKIGRILGIDVYLHVTFLLLLGLMASLQTVAGGGLAAGLRAAGFLAAVFACVLLHEFGHALAARKFGIRTRDITLLPIGGVACLERMPSRPAQELWVALAGPLVNVAIAGLLAIGLGIAGIWPSLTLSTVSGSFAERLLAVNLFLVVFNLLPAFPMDGGRVLRAVLAMRLEHLRATRIAVRTGRVMAVLFAVAGLFHNPFLLLIALFVWMGATQEGRTAEVKQTISGLPVREVMLTDFEALQPEDRLGRAMFLVLRGWQQDFPVMESGRVVGVLTRDALLQGLKTRGPSAPVKDAMRHDFIQVEEAELLEEAVFTRKAPEFSIVPVTRGERVVGLLTAENFAEFLAIRSALSGRSLAA